MITGYAIEVYDANTFDNIKKAEDIRKSVPTKFQINEVERILKDFGYRGMIPEFNTYAELDAFRRNQIDKLLNRR